MLGCQTTVTANTAWWLIAILFCVCTDKPHRVNLKALLDSHISFSPLNAGEQVKCPMQPPLNVAVSCHARGQTLPCLLQHRWWYLSRYLRQSGKTPSLVSRNSLKVVSRPLRVKIAAGHIISVICLSSSQEQLCGSVGMVKVWLDSEATSVIRT